MYLDLLLLKSVNQAKKSFDEGKRACNFYEPSKDRTFPLPVLDKVIWINPERMGKGNSKLKDILIFDLPAGSKEGGSCHNSKSCEKTCYAMNQQRQYVNTRIFRLTNMLLLNQHKETLQTLLETQIKKSKFNTVRIHSSGDFYSQNEIDMWSTIISKFKDHKVYAYTKVNKMFDFSSIKSNDNFNLIDSIVEDKYLNYGSLDYITRIAEKTGGFLCPATLGKDVKCNRECSYCVTGDKPFFLIHGSNAPKAQTKKAS